MAVVFQQSNRPVGPTPSSFAQVARQPEGVWPEWWRLLVIMCAALVLCSCRGVPRGGHHGNQPSAESALAAPPSECAACTANGMNTLPPSAYTGPMQVPNGAIANWAPPGIGRPWPEDEYIGDGGDRGAQVLVHDDWRVTGMEPEDTIAHYDTLDGERKVTPSNYVPLYAPKFAAVRKVRYAEIYQTDWQLQGIHRPESTALQDHPLPSSAVSQPIMPEGEIGRIQLTAQQRNEPPLHVDNEDRPLEAANRLKPYEDFLVVQVGQLRDAEKARLAVSIDAAIAWTADQGAQVILDSRMASVETGDQIAQTTYSIGEGTSPRLRLIKVASTDTARPGQIVEFTLRYDNTGTQLIGNVTIIDNLTTRLEYVEGSASSDRNAQFSVEENDAGSLRLRWEVADPLPPAEGGVLRFKCRVR